MLDSLIPLQEKASAFFNQYETKYAKQMNCAKGCSHCCIGGLSIFTWEAALIIDWFNKLPVHKQKELIAIWNTSSSSYTDFTDVEGKPATACVFLSQGQCSIYTRRPIICRTQGMGLKWSEKGTIHRDNCPLNFTSNISAQIEDDLNLDVLNQMMVQAQIIFKENGDQSIFFQHSGERIELAQLKSLLMKNGENRDS
jgi:uncharacterized protein